MDTIGLVLADVFRAISGDARVRAIGVSGGKSAFPLPGESDVDVFVYGDSVPAVAEREELYRQCAGLFEDMCAGFFEGETWGAGDRALVRGVEVFFMYFTRDAVRSEIRSILSGKRAVCEDGFYPTGRLGMYASMTAHYDPDGFLAETRNAVAAYPDVLARTQIDWALDRLADREELRHSAMRRDLTGYHAFWDRQAEALFVALFACNRVYYPGRKRNLSIAEGFAILPAGLTERLRRSLALMATEDTLGESFAQWSSLTQDVTRLAREQTAMG